MTTLPLPLFRDWLESCTQDLPCGDPLDPVSCPLARWIRAREWPQAQVVNGRLYPAPGAASEELPTWARWFEAAVQRRRGPVTARVALKVLSRVEGMTR